MKKFRKIQNRLFISHLSIAVFVFIITAIIFFQYNLESIRKNNLDSFVKITKSLSSQMDSFVHNMNSTSLDILVSKIHYYITSEKGNDINPTSILLSDNNFSYIYDYFFRVSNSLSSNAITDWDRSEHVLSITNIINSINGPSPRVSEVIMYDDDGLFISAPFSSKLNNYEISKRIKQNKSKNDAIMENGSFILIPPHIDEWEAKSTYVISLARSFTSHYRKGIIEIQQDFYEVEKIIDPIIEGKPVKLFIADKSGELIYPLESKEYKDELKSLLKKTSTISGIQPNHTYTFSDRDETIIQFESSYTGWKTIVRMTNRDFLPPDEINSFKLRIAIITLVILFIIFLLTYIVSRSITSPIKLLHRIIKNTKYENLLELDNNKGLSSIQEVWDVYQSMVDLCKELDKSLKENIDIRTKEANAHLSALQAQIKPHFIYNTLSIISISCDEGNVSEASELCRTLATMLKYITKYTTNLVELRNELDHTKNYLALMKIRYEDYLLYELDYMEDVLELKLPKLVIQPLVENCITHGFKESDPPWRIRINCYVKSHSYIIEVIDNGKGIDSDTLKDIIHGIDNYTSNNESKEVEKQKESNSLGLFGTLTRLTLMFKESFSYYIGNLEEGGFIVRLEFRNINGKG